MHPLTVDRNCFLGPVYTMQFCVIPQHNVFHGPENGAVIETVPRKNDGVFPRTGLTVQCTVYSVSPIHSLNAMIVNIFVVSISN